MGFDTIISNGSVVTATDTYVADVAITDGKISAIGEDLPRENATTVLDASGKLCFARRHRRTYSSGHAFRGDDQRR